VKPHNVGSFAAWITLQEVNVIMTDDTPKPANQQPLFNPDLEPIRYLVGNSTLEFTLDGKFNTFWLSQKHIAALFNLDVSTISEHVANFKSMRGDESDATIRKFRLVQKEGNRDVERSIEHYNHSVVIYIGYRAQATEETIRFQRFVEEVFRQRMEDEHQRAIKKAVHERDTKYTGYVLAGMSPSHAQTRLEGQNTFKRLAGQIVRLTDGSMIGRVVGKEYVMLFGKVSEDLKKTLHTKNIRDALPELPLKHIELIESSIATVLSNRKHMSDDEIMALAINTIKPMANNLKMVCEAAGLDIITGKPAGYITPTNRKLPDGDTQ
jgi:hypothetical protein